MAQSSDSVALKHECGLWPEEPFRYPFSQREGIETVLTLMRSTP